MASPYPAINVYGRLDSLLDTNISSPSANFVLYYDGTDWVNATSATTSVDVGQGLRIYDADPTYAITLAFNNGGASDYTLKLPNNVGAVGYHLEITDVTGTVVTTDWQPADGTISGGTNLGAGTGQVYAATVAPNLQFRTLVQGYNARITQTSTEITIDTCETVVNQTAHGFTAGQVVYWNSTAWALAQANAVTTLATGMVVAVIDADNFVFANNGIFTITAHGLGAAGTFLYTSPTSSGAVVTTNPSTSGQFSNPVGQVLTTNSLSLMTMRAYQVP